MTTDLRLPSNNPGICIERPSDDFLRLRVAATFGYIEDVVEALRWSDHLEDVDALLGEGNPFGQDLFAKDYSLSLPLR